MHILLSGILLSNTNKQRSRSAGGSGSRKGNNNGSNSGPSNGQWQR